MKAFARSLWVSALGAALSLGCAGVDADGSSSSEVELEDPGLGTESGTPTEIRLVEDGTESGNPGPADVTPAEQNGTESGNPTRPPPAGIVCSPVPGTEPMTGIYPSDGPMPSAIGGAPGIDVPSDGSPAGAAPVGVAAMPGTDPRPSAAVGACVDQECLARADAFAATYMQPLPAPSAFSDAVCSPAGECSCVRDGAATVLRAAEEGSCLVQGRLGCVFAAEEYPTCSPGALEGDANSCKASCDSLWAAETADAAGLDVSVRVSACTAAGCRFVLETGAACFVAGSDVAPAESDCSLSDEQLLGSR